MLTIALLGSPAITRDGAPLPVARRKSRAILYYLAAQDPRASLTRDQLLAFFWPDLDRAAAQQTLRTTLHGLRRTVGPALRVEEDRLSFSPDTQIDVRQMASLSREPWAWSREPAFSITQLSTAWQLYRGDFLAGFTLPEPPAFDDWAAIEREHYRRLAVRCLAALSQLYETGGDYSAALESLERALAFDPLQEDLQRAAMRLHYLAGDRTAAIRRYDALRKMLNEEMGVPPMAETRSLYDALITEALPIPPPAPRSRERPAAVLSDGRQQLAVPQAPASPALPFIGREAELQRLQSLAAESRLVLIEGEPGIGKTRLAEEYIQASNSLGLVGSAHELEGALPYQPVIEALRSLLGRTDWPALRATLQATVSPVWLAEVARLLPELELSGAARPAPAAVESRLWEGLHQYLRAVAARHSVILFVDDVQWADSATLALLGYLVRQPPAGIFYLVTARAVAPRSPLAALLQTLTRENRLAQLALRRLTPPDVAALAQSVCGQHAESLAGWLAQSSEGNPYVLAELLRYARESGLIEDGRVDLDRLSKSPVVPQTVYTLTLSRLNRLSDAARHVLDAAVAAGREFEFDIVYRAAGLSEAAALDALDELQTAGLIRALEWTTILPARLMYAFDHSLTMEVAYRAVGEARHRLLHRRVAEAYAVGRGRPGSESAAGDSEAGLIAWHYSEGDAADLAAPYALRAGQRATRIAAWHEAAEFFSQALAGGLDRNGRRSTYLELGEALIRTGEAARAAEAFRSALSESRPGDDESWARLALARSLFAQARFAEAVEELQPIHTDDLSLAAQREFNWGAALSVEGADLAAATEHLRQADGLLAESGQPADLPILAQTRFELGSVAAQQGDLARAIALYREALDIAEEAPADTGVLQQVLADNNLAYHLHLLDDPTALDFARAGLLLAQEKGILPAQTYLYSTLGEIALAAGDLDEAERRFNEGLALAERLNVPERMAGLTANLGRVALARGQTDLAIHRLSTALARADSLGTRHLAATIRLWLVPLLPSDEARLYLAEARAFAESSGRQRLLAEADRLTRDRSVS